ncbi:DUF4149 domain-containing protein [Helicobacter cetorum]|uniref:DUF4149 domain-containing protein n=1 Tax=Helicobacter cetorum TaxID=138563 RepID=UPI0018F7FDEF|nr:DUF4149 domain-containing protein [Helicobacter cetorum]
MKKICLGVYLLILGMLCGAILILGTIVAPIVFKAQVILPELSISSFEVGKIMAHVFARFNRILEFVGFIVLGYEVISFIWGKRFWVHLVLGLIIGGLSLLFVFYYTPYILHAQELGEAATKSADFISMHSQSKWLFKQLFILICILFFMRLWSYKRQGF